MNTKNLYAEIKINTRLVFSRSSGPGGQNVNKLNTKVTGFLEIEKLTVFSLGEISQIKEKLKNRLNEKNELVVSSQNSRSQLNNKETLYAKVTKLIIQAAHRSARRKPTSPSKSAKNKRLLIKKRKGFIKSHRKKPGISDE